MTASLSVFIDLLCLCFLGLFDIAGEAKVHAAHTNFHFNKDDLTILFAFVFTTFSAFKIKSANLISLFVSNI